MLSFFFYIRLVCSDAGASVRRNATATAATAATAAATAAAPCLQQTAININNSTNKPVLVVAERLCVTITHEHEHTKQMLLLFFYYYYVSLQ